MDGNGTVGQLRVKGILIKGQIRTPRIGIANGSRTTSTYFVPVPFLSIDYTTIKHAQISASKFRDPQQRRSEGPSCLVLIVITCIATVN